MFEKPLSDQYIRRIQNAVFADNSVWFHQILKEIRAMSSTENTVSTEVSQLTSVVAQIQSNTSAVLAEVQTLQGAKAGDTITADQEAAIQTALTSLQSINTSLAGALPHASGTDTTQGASGSSTVSGSAS